MVHLANPSLAQTLNPLSQSPPSALSTRHWGRRAELGDTHGLADGAHFKSMLWTLRGAGKPQDTPQSVHPPTLPDTTPLETLVLRLSWRPGCLSPQKKRTLRRDTPSPPAEHRPTARLPSASCSWAICALVQGRPPTWAQSPFLLA